MRLYQTTIFIFALIYASILTWGFPIDGMLDRPNYLLYVTNAFTLIISNISKGELSFIFNEPIWLSINFCLGLLFSPENVVRIFIFFSSFLTFYVCVKNNIKHVFLMVLILIYPQVIKNYIIHLRQGLAVSIFIYAWYLTNKKIKLFVMLCTPLIHASFFFVVFIYFVVKFLTKLKLARDVKLLALFVLGFIIAIVIPILTLYLGARQANEYNFSDISVSGGAFILWFVILMLFWFQGKVFFKIHTFEISSIGFYLSTYFFTPVTARIFESSILLVFIAGLYLSSWRKYLYIFLFLLTLIYTYYSRINLPYFGWGFS
ncbi:hypothetical protein NFHSH190041_26440 [Shewanella sp. NFH-SH190041]|uniref:EpsG family protein n=1 Tax=Shewanella sp. NFH-SH190041 TaxID=2950245 RepID=UPI0021C430F9|nr:EpsG family protein [Shewanella sp. NFH-SH190041]BDM65192.1 hypothetical protein NFHSH190041_26440 [Shewanella sp. NFH-SH190041]